MPGAVCGAATVASAISFFRTGDHVVVVARPTWRPTLYTGTATRDAAADTCGARPMSSYSASIAGQLMSRPTICRAGPRRCSSRERRPADERPRVQLDEAAEPHLERRVFLRLDQRLLAAVEIDLDEQKARLDAGDIEREHAGRMNVERAAAVTSARPRRPMARSHGIQIS